MTSLRGESSRSYLGRSASVSVSRACPKCGPAEATQTGRAEVSRGRSRATTFQPPPEGPNISYQGISRHDLDPSTSHRNQFAHLNESRHSKASPCPVESQRDQSEPAAMMTKPLEHSSVLLMEKIVDTDNLERAWKKVRSNHGAPGPDGITIDEFPEHFREHWSVIRQQLLDGTSHGQSRTDSA